LPDIMTSFPRTGLAALTHLRLSSGCARAEWGTVERRLILTSSRVAAEISYVRLLGRIRARSPRCITPSYWCSVFLKVYIEKLDLKKFLNVIGPESRCENRHRERRLELRYR